jgi:hypothetical protein
LKSFLDLNVLSLILIISSIILALYPLFYMGVSEIAAKHVEKSFKTIEFALRHFFYNEGFELIPPEEINIETLVQRYYLSKNPGGEYSILWLDSDASDKKVSAAVICLKNIDPVAAAKVIKNVLWFDKSDGKLHKDYKDGRLVTLVVEVKQG